MNPRSTLSHVVGVLAIALLAACGSDGNTPVDGADTGTDAGSGGSTDAVDGPDAGTDTDDDAAPDVTEDTEPDTEPDAEPDTEPDVEPDTTPDAEPDTEPDAEEDVTPDVEPDVVAPPNCGDGIIQADEGEACDDGNDDDSDTCTTLCQDATCGDGFVGLQRGPVLESAPVVENPFGVSGPVCDTGATCPGGTCDVSADDTAPEHGICQTLGHFRAISVTYGGSVGADADPAVRANNWGCFDYECTEGPSSDSDGACGDGRMLVEIVCDGWVEEPCDDGDNGTGPNQCRPGCELPTCGDGVTDDAFGEDCDDANDVPEDGCNLCLFPQCGDGIVQAGEECDDGNDSDEDECRSDCTFPVCGDGIVQPGEECDDGDANSEAPDACRPTCALAGCGDLVIDTGEECDDGNDVAEDGCSNNCLTPQCGDGIVQTEAPFNEECDDGNRVDDDACSNACVTAICGDGIIQSAPPNIDVTYDFADGIPDNFNVAPNTWELFNDAERGQVLQSTDIDDEETVGFSVDVVFASETEVSFWYRVDSESCCDDLNFYVNGANELRLVGQPTWATATVTVPAGEHTLLWTYEKDISISTGLDNAAIDDIRFFGAPVIGEECDDGEANADEADACRASTCLLPTCLDGITDSDEECDDGNTVNNDTCSNACTLPICGDGIVQGDEECDEGDDNSDTEVNGCRTDCRAAYCTDGVIDAGEECDDGNEIGGDGCSNLCRTPRCGDGFADLTGELVDPPAPEECDDGNTVNDDECSNACTLPICGDGIVQGLEECDDENDINDDGCSNNCLLPGCGDNILQPGEGCDDGNLDDGDACSSDCRPAGCGNEVLDEGEECDDGNLDPADGCTNACLLPVCGDRVTHAGEDCDDGNDSTADACNPDCTYTTCGDGIINSPRQETTYFSPVVTNPFGATGRVCDDGQSCFADVCDYSEAPDAPEHGICQALGGDITLEIVWGEGEGDSDPEMPHVYNWVCENFVCGPGGNDFSSDNCSSFEMLNTITCLQATREQCDDGVDNADVADACRTNCQLPFCGDGIVDTGEECDDGNDIEDDTCSSLCRAPVCGDGILQGDEECDDGDDNANVGDACRTNCALPICGDSITDTGEGCDDGSEGSALCRPDCILATCGNGALDDGEACDDGNTDGGDGCRANCTEELCGDGILDPTEICDDGNDVDDDGCSNTCAANGIEGADITVSGTGVGIATGDTTGESDTEVGSCGGGSGTVSISWVAPSTGSFLIETCGSGYDTVLYVRSDALDGPEVACNDDWFAGACADDFDGLTSSVVVDATEGDRYAIFVDGYFSEFIGEASQGPFSLSITEF